MSALPLIREPITGSYFVSAYPPFSFWSEAQLGAFRQRLERPPEAGPSTPFGLYVHIPFCEARCRYCYYLSYEDRSQEIDRYLETLERELLLYSETPFLSGRRVDFVYFGGGTPSLLSLPRLRKLLAGLDAIYPWSRAREVSFECAPRSVNGEKLALLRESGVTRISLGAQQFDDQVLAASGRVHRVADVERAWEAIHRAGFPVTNLDLIVGLPGETDATVAHSLERTIEMGPEMVTLYQLEIPGNTPLYRALRDGELPAAPPSWEQKRKRLARAFARLEEAGYTVRSAYAAVRDPLRHAFVYQDQQYRGADLLGIGASAFSYLGGAHQQSLAALDDYLEAGRRGLPLARAYVLSPEERLAREFLLQLKLGGLEREPFRAKFGVDPARRFAEPLADLAARGWLEIDAEAIRLTRAGLLRADRLLPLFYLPQHLDAAWT